MIYISRLSIISIVLLALGIGFFSAPETTDARRFFADIIGHSYRASIDTLIDAEVLEGYEDGTFRPNNPASRAEMMKIIFAASLGIDRVPEGANCFSDVTDKWYAKYVCYAQKQGIVEGYPPAWGNAAGRRTFRPAQNVSMIEVFKIASLAFDMPVAEQKDGDAWFDRYIDFAHNNNLFSKYSYHPGRDATRAEISFFVHQLMRIRDGERELSSKRDSRSPGCFKTAPANPPTSGTVSGRNREWIAVVPRAWDKKTPIPLTIAFHGRTNPNTMVRTYYKVEEASKGGTIILYPAGLPAGSGRGWSNPGDPPDKLRDFALFDYLVSTFSEQYCVDMDRIYVVGHSLGAWFTNSLSCARGDVIRAIGSLGGGTTKNNCTGPVAAMVWHNPKDNLTAFSQGETARNQLREQNYCSTSFAAAQPSAANCIEYNDCSPEAPLVWCPHNFDYADWGGYYYPHTWPNITGPEIWRFFESLED